MDRYLFPEKEHRLMEKSPVPFAIYQFVDHRVVTIALSDGFCRLFGYTDRKKAYHDMDNDMYIDTHPDDVARIAEDALSFATEGGAYDTVYRSGISGTNDYRIIHARGEHFLTETGARLAVVWYTDEGRYSTDGSPGETELNQYLSESMHEHSMLRSNNYDFLTGLPNMMHFFVLADYARKAFIRNGSDPLILFIDLNGMKFYNSKYGYSKGDELLVSFAHLLAKYFGNENCCRMGEDHFCVVTGDSSIDERLGELFSEWKSLHRGEGPAIHIGIYRNSIEPVSISSACDRAKYACSSLRRNYTSDFCWFDREMLHESKDRQYIIENIDRAIGEKWIRVYYQAIVRSTNGKVCDEEALARWIDPERGMLSPAEFIPVLEEAGLIYKLDLYVVEQVLEKIKTLREYGLTNIAPVSINLSRTDFESCDIIDEICRRVDAAGFSHDVLSIEITESTVARDEDFMKAQVERFRELGFPVWMDDFGSGYSSLDVLQTIKFDLIKFDMHFMQQFDNGEETRIILTELMKMANALGVETICEGVEKEEQVLFLREIGCTKMQGFYFEKPAPLEALIESFEKGTAIGIENPDEKEYYEAIGRINLYDLSMVAGRDDSNLKNYLNTLPMGIIEVNGDKARFLRTNKAYRDFVENAFGHVIPRSVEEFSCRPKGIGPYFLGRVMECSENKSSTIVDEILPNNTTVHTFLRNIGSNTVTGTTAVAIAVLAVTENSEELTYANIARAMAADYINLFYVDLDTDEFIEYTSYSGQERVAAERRDSDFFTKARRDALIYLYEEDREMFLAAFTKENIIKTLDEQRALTLTYRQMIGGSPVYLNMKVTRMQEDDSKIIIGVSNVNLQMRQRREIEQLMQEKILSSRIKALTGDFIVMYCIDPETGRYIESSATSEYEGLGVSKAGDDFFRDKDINADRFVHPADAERFKKTLEKENILRTLKKDGLLTLKYHFMIDGEPNLVKLRAALIKESDGEKLIMAVNHISD